MSDVDEVIVFTNKHLISKESWHWKETRYVMYE